MRHFATNVMYTICFGSLVFVYVFVVVYTKIELDTSHTQHTRARARWIFSKFSSFFPADRHILVRVIILLEWSECSVTALTHQGRNSVAVKETTLIGLEVWVHFYFRKSSIFVSYFIHV